MIRTASLRRQHDAALLLAGEIKRLIAELGEAPHADGAFRITLLFAKLTGALRIHFAQEDKLLYPALMASGRGGTAATARRFFEEMGRIGPAFADYVEKWRTSAAILADWKGFRGETEALFAALADRIARENEELYPLADDLADDRAPYRAA